MTDDKARMPTSNDEQRIALATAMGWRDCGIINDALRGKPSDYSCDLYAFGPPELPNPFTDANDDYAVLEWMRGEQGWPRWLFISEGIEYCYDYEIGDYARAALQVLDNDQ